MKVDKQVSHYPLYILVSLQGALVAVCTHWAMLSVISAFARFF